ncbi:MAG TPA: response regulator, partial [Burkholderiales bacterium]|nr:response regulator [Burkholderiales bacterium]
MSERIYRLTAAGRAAWESQDAAVPADYRRLLWLLDYQGHAGLLRELVHHYPRAALDEWLAELEELGLIEPVPRGAEQTQDFVARAPDRTVALADVREAREDLARTGVYLALDRVKGRARWTRAPHETAILIVEDDPDQLALADLRVSMAGYQVRVATSAHALLQSLFDEGAPDLLLLDIGLPDGDGFEILRRLRRHKALGVLPVILLTARDAPADIGRGLALGADGYVTKP